MTDALINLLPQIMPTEMVGSVVHTDGLATSVAGFPAPVGALVEIERQTGSPLRGEVIGFRDDDDRRLSAGQLVGRAARQPRAAGRARRGSFASGDALLGRVIDAQGKPLDHLPEPGLTSRTRLDRTPPAGGGAAADPRAAVHGHSRVRRAADVRPRPAHGHLLRLGRRQERAAGHDGALHGGRRQRDRADRRTRPRSQRVPASATSVRQAWPAAWWSWPPATSRRWCASRRR